MSVDQDRPDTPDEDTTVEFLLEPAPYAARPARLRPKAKRRESAEVGPLAPPFEPDGPKLEVSIRISSLHSWTIDRITSDKNANAQLIIQLSI